MKKILLSIVTITIGFTSLAQENVIKANIFSPLFKTGSFFYERALSDQTSAQLGFYFTAFNIGESKWRGFGITPEFRYYPMAEGINGFYIAPFLRYQSLTVTQTYTDNTNVYDSSGNIIGTTSEEKEAKGTLSTFGGGALIGRQWIFGEHVSLDIFIGPSYNAGSISYDGDTTDPDSPTFDAGSFDGFGVRTGVTLGFAF